VHDAFFEDLVTRRNLIAEASLSKGVLEIRRAQVDAARGNLHAHATLKPAPAGRTISAELTASNAIETLGDYDVIADGSDNFPTRYLVNDACVLLGKPNVHGSVFRLEGQASVFGVEDGPCYRCLYPEPPPPHLLPSCAEGGVLGVLPAIIGSIQAVETIKLVLGNGEGLSGRLLLFDALKMTFRELEVRKSPQCPVCGPNKTIHELIDYDEFCGVSGAARPSTEVPDITALDLKAKIDAGDNPFLLDVREPHEFSICHLDGTLIPMADLPSRVHELDPSQEIVVYCSSGARSASAVQFLRRAGFDRVLHLRGGIFAWSDEVDPSVPKY